MSKQETETHNTETSRRKLIYSSELKSLVSENPELIQKILQSLKGIGGQRTYELGEKIKPVENDGLILEMVQNRPYSEIYKATLPNGKELCLKIEKQNKENIRSNGHEEFLASKKANSLIEKVPGVRTINFQLGYKDKERSFFLSEWENFEPLNEYLDRLWERKDANQDNEAWRKILSLNQRVQELQKIFAGFHDFDEKNMFYDPLSDDIILFDLSYL